MYSCLFSNIANSCLGNHKFWVFTVDIFDYAITFNSYHSNKWQHQSITVIFWYRKRCVFIHVTTNYFKIQRFIGWFIYPIKVWSKGLFIMETRFEFCGNELILNVIDYIIINDNSVFIKVVVFIYYCPCMLNLVFSSFFAKLIDLWNNLNCLLCILAH